MYNNKDQDKHEIGFNTFVKDHDGTANDEAGPNVNDDDNDDNYFF